MQIIFILIAMLISGFFYYVGGRSKEELPWAKGWMRDLGCTLTSAILAYCLVPKIEIWSICAFAALQFWACRSYFNWINKILSKFSCAICKHTYSCDCCCYNIEFSQDKRWYNWLAIGIVSSAKWLIFFPATPEILSILVSKSLFVMICSELMDNAKKEEFLRGIFVI